MPPDVVQCCTFTVHSVPVNAVTGGKPARRTRYPPRRLCAAARRRRRVGPEARGELLTPLQAVPVGLQLALDRQ